MATPGIYENGVVTVRFAAPMTIRSNQPVFSMDTLSLKRQTTSQKAQRWEIVSNLEASNTSNDFFMSAILNGYDKTFQIQMPQPLRAKNQTTVFNGNMVLSTGGTKGSTSIQVSGFAGTIYRGEFVKFASSDKVYILTNDVVSGGSVGIYPALRTAVNNGTAMSYRDNVLMRCLYDSSTVLGITYVDGILNDPGSVTFIEAL